MRREDFPTTEVVGSRDIDWWLATRGACSRVEGVEQGLIVGSERRAVGEHRKGVVVCEVQGMCVMDEGTSKMENEGRVVARGWVDGSPR